jgi:hypothetical protein
MALNANNLTTRWRNKPEKSQVSKYIAVVVIVVAATKSKSKKKE